jgi:hypothetical protein
MKLHYSLKRRMRTRPLSTQQQTHILNTVCDLFGVRWEFYETTPDAFEMAYADSGGGTIYVSVDLTRTYDMLLTIAVHEAYHVIAYRLGKFMGYHNPSKEPWTKDDAKRYTRQALAAETWVDKQAAKWQEVFDFKYHWVYASEESRALFRVHIADIVSDELLHVEIAELQEWLQQERESHEQIRRRA